MYAHGVRCTAKTVQIMLEIGNHVENKTGSYVCLQPGVGEFGDLSFLLDRGGRLGATCNSRVCRVRRSLDLPRAGQQGVVSSKRIIVDYPLDGSQSVKPQVEMKL